jgi:hypothetical protein
MLSRKNYVAIADALNKTRKKMIDDISTDLQGDISYTTQEFRGVTSPAVFEQQIINYAILRVTARIADYFEDDNPSFNRDKFRAAVWK